MPPPELTMEDCHLISLRRGRIYQQRSVGGQPSNLGQSLDDVRHSNQGASEWMNSAPKDSRFEKATHRNPPSSMPRSAGDIQDPDSAANVDRAAEQELIDPKSFPQNLFTTLAVRMVEWLPLSRAPNSFERQPEAPATRATQDLPGTEKESRGDKKLERPKKENRRPTTSSQPTSQPRTPSSRASESKHPAVELKFQNQHVKRVSISEVDNWHQSPRSSLDEKKKPEFNKKISVTADELPTLPSPPALKHRPQKHRGRIDSVESVPLKERRKNQRRVSWNSENLLNEISPAKSSANANVMAPPAPYHSDLPSEHRTGHIPVEVPPDTIPLAQTVTHLTPEIIDGLSQIMIESEEDDETWRQELAQIQSTGSFEQPNWQFATVRQREAFPFIAQSAFFVLNSPHQILRSFISEHAHKHADETSHLDVSQLFKSLQRLFLICPWDIALHSLWGSLDRIFISPHGLTSGILSHRSSRSSTMTGSVPPVAPRRISGIPNEFHLSDPDAAHIATIALFALISFMPKIDPATWQAVAQMRSNGLVASYSDMRNLAPENAQQAVEVTDRFEHELALRLISRLVRAITARLAYHEIAKARQTYDLGSSKQRRVSVLDRVVDYLSEYHTSHVASSNGTKSVNPASFIIEWLRTLFLREWDGNPEMTRSSAAGGAIQILSSLYKARNRLGLSPEEFHTPLLTERLDSSDMPVAWVGRLTNNRTMHLLSYSFLFPPSSLVIYFRALNHSVMNKFYEAAVTTTRHVTQTAFGAIRIADDPRLLTRMKTSMSTYLVLVVRRDNILSDALSQLWRREKRELMRPLKVQMGMDEGEEGLDHGGVQQEFFRLLMGQAFDPCYGMFTTDSRHRVSWFQPCSLEPLYKFELLGLLMSIAIYNGLTLPVNLPIAFYRKVLGLKVKHLNHIRDGWPELSQGLDTLLTWTDGDVEDIFTRTYEFSFEAFGSIESVDMQKVDRDSAWPVARKCPESIAGSSVWMDIPSYCDPASMSPSMEAKPANSTPSHSGSTETSKSASESLSLRPPTPPADEAALVTNQNRQQFVKDYIFWLTDKSIRPQFEAFQRGLNTCLDRSALSIFSPEALKAVVEGIQTIDSKELENHARYEGGFGPSHRVIRDFWSVVHGYSNEKKAQLLEFVTASDRVPVNGIRSIMFVIQKNGVGDLVCHPFPCIPNETDTFSSVFLPV